MNLNETMKQLVEVQAEIEKSIDPDCPAHLLAGRELRLNQTKAAARELTVEVRKLVENVAGGIFVNGNGTEKFAEIAADEGNAIVIDGSALYREIADAADKTLDRSNRFWRYDVMATIYDVLTRLCDRLGIRYMRPLDASSYVDSRLSTYPEVLAAINVMLDRAVGIELNTMFLREDIARKVIDARYDQNVIPVVVTGIATSEQAAYGQALFSGRFVTINTKEAVEKNDVITAFKHLKPHFKPKIT